MLGEVKLRKLENVLKRRLDYYDEELSHLTRIDKFNNPANFMRGMREGTKTVLYALRRCRAKTDDCDELLNKLHLIVTTLHQDKTESLDMRSVEMLYNAGMMEEYKSIKEIMEGEYW